MTLDKTFCGETGSSDRALMTGRSRPARKSALVCPRQGANRNRVGFLPASDGTHNRKPRFDSRNGDFVPNASFQMPGDVATGPVWRPPLPLRRPCGPAEQLFPPAGRPAISLSLAISSSVQTRRLSGIRCTPCQKTSNIQFLGKFPHTQKPLLG